MPRSYARKTNKCKWSEEQLIAAINEIRNGRAIREVGRAFEIPESTLRDRLKFQNTKPSKLGRNPVFTEDQEKVLAQHVIKLANVFFGITPVELRRLAYDFAEAEGIKHPFLKEKKLAGKDWLELFLKRNSNISLRKPEPTSQSRITAFNQIEVHRFFKNLSTLLEKHKFKESRIFNVDETGISTVQKPAKILAPKGQKQVGAVTSWERGKNVTAICAISALGQFIPPLFIYPRVRMNHQLQKNGPIGAEYSCSKTGWSNEEIFFKWLQHFNMQVKATVDDPVLLILDNHSSHISLTIYNYCKSNGIIMLSLPPHTSHKMQPLDLTFFGPLKNAFNRECDMYLRTHTYEKISHYDLAELFNNAYVKVATMDKGISGFRAAGIWPLNPDKFSEDDFYQTEENNITSIQAPINLDESDITQNREAIPLTIPENPKSNVEKVVIQSSPLDSDKLHAPEIQPGPSGLCSRTISTIENLAPLPTSTKQRSSTSRSKQHSEILTSTPYKLQLEEAQEKKNKKVNQGQVKKNKRKRQCEELLKKGPTKDKKQTSNIKNSSKCRKKLGWVRNIVFDDTDSDAESLDEKDLCDDNELDDIDPTNVNICLVCDEFGRDNEVWYRCVFCSRWSHSECSGWDSAENYTCDFCLNKV